MSKHLPPKMNPLQKALRHQKVLGQEVLMYQRLMEVMRDENTFQDILKFIITSVTKGLGYDRAGIFLADWERKVVERVIGINRFGKLERKGVEFPLTPHKPGDGFSNIINGFEKGSYTNNFRRKVHKREWSKNIDPGVFCNAVVPMTVGDNKNIGILAVDNLFTQRRLKKADLVTLTNFATQAGMAIESFRLHDQVRTLTIRDGLTGVFNRRYFDNYFPREIQRCRRYKRLLTLLYLDLDHFKNINDLYGHPAGDAVLKHTASLLVKDLRNVDIVVRMGGDEFAVILPEVGPDGAKTVAERLFKSITNSPAPVEAISQGNEKITVSMGISCLSNSINDYKGMVKFADQSLYQAKNAGRNRLGDLITHQP